MKIFFVSWENIFCKCYENIFCVRWKYFLWREKIFFVSAMKIFFVSWENIFCVWWKYFLCREKYFLSVMMCVSEIFFCLMKIFLCRVKIFWARPNFERVPTWPRPNLGVCSRPNYRRPNYRRPNLSASQLERVPTWRPSASQRVPARPSASQRVPGRPNASRMSYLLRCCPGASQLHTASQRVPTRPNLTASHRVPTRPPYFLGYEICVGLGGCESWCWSEKGLDGPRWTMWCLGAPPEHILKNFGLFSQKCAHPENPLFWPFLGYPKKPLFLAFFGFLGFS
jgi:hypothetical protein